MQYSQEHLKTMVYAEFGGQTECIMGNWNREWHFVTRAWAGSEMVDTQLRRLNESLIRVPITSASGRL